jgi:hypothetical protein
MYKNIFSPLLPSVHLLFFSSVPFTYLTITHEELKDPEKYNTQEPMADETVLKDQLRLYK